MKRTWPRLPTPDYPGERLIACRNPLLAAERARKRQDLLAATEKELAQGAGGHSAEQTSPTSAIGLAVGRVLGRYKMAKHFQIFIEENQFRNQRHQAHIAAEAALDGIYVVRTSVRMESASAEQTVRYYKELSNVERAFRSMKSVDLKVRLSITIWSIS